MIVKNNIYTHIVGRLSLPQFKVFGFILLFLGGYLIYLLNYWGIFVLLVGVGLYFSVLGLQIDFNKNQRREFFGIFGYKFGKWKPLPKIEYVTIFVERYAQRGSVASIDNVQHYSKLNVSLIVSKTERYEAGFFHDKSKALETGKLIARNLNIKLLDYTTKEPKWVNLNNDDFKQTI